MSKYFIEADQIVSIINQLKKFLLVFIIVFFPLFLFFFSGQTIYASMNSVNAVYKGNIKAIKPLVGEVVPTINYQNEDGQAFENVQGPRLDVMVSDVSIHPTGIPLSYNLTLAVSGNGSVIVNPDQTNFDPGDIIMVTAAPTSGWSFNGWNGDVTSITDPLTLTMDADKNITATFVNASDPAYTLTINTIGEGTITPDPLQVTYSSGEVVTLTAIADSGWLFDNWSGDLSGITNTQSLVIDSDKEVTGTFVSMPIISNVTVYTFPTKAVIQWETNKLATSQIDFGTTTTYDETISDTQRTFSHTLVIPDLMTDTIYHYQITSMDIDGLITSTAHATFTTATFTNNSGIVSDDFNAGTVDSAIWTFVNPVGDGSATLNGTELLLNAPAGVDHDVWTHGNRSVRLMQPSNDTDFEIEVKFTSSLTREYQMQGLLIEEDIENFLRFDFYSEIDDDTDEVIIHLYSAIFTDQNQYPKTIVINRILDGWDNPLFMRVTRFGDVWFFWISADGVDWELATLFEEALSVSQVGVFAGNTADILPPEHTAVVDYFFNTAAPIDPEDANAEPLILTTNVVGAGHITVEPDKAGYAFGEAVTLTAVPDSEWSFNHWSGDAVGSSNPVVITMESDETVTTTFISDLVTTYVLTPSIIGNGSVMVEPDKVSYLPGEVVTVTAVAETGWLFNNWSGDIVGSTLSKTIMMDSDKIITATFIEETDEVYDLNINIEGEGEVNATPDKVSYYPGEIVTVTAVADVGWEFTDWSGDVPDDSTSSIQITMDANKSLTATFTQQTFSLITNVNGQGNVTVDPMLPYYTYGQEITLTAQADSGWEFDDWSGGTVSDSVNPEQIIVEGNIIVTANFIQTEYYIFLPIIIKP